MGRCESAICDDYIVKLRIFVEFSIILDELPHYCRKFFVG